MRWLIFGAGLTLLGFTSPASAQDASPPLERLIDINYGIRVPAHECSVPSAVMVLARHYRFIAGVEYLLVDCQRRWAETRRDAEVINLQGLSVGAALDKLTAIDPRYRWVQRDGLIVVRPVDAWADPKDPLNFATASFVLEDVNVGGALEAIVTALNGSSSGNLPASAERTEQGRRRFSVKTGAVSAAEALDAIVRAHGDAIWDFSYTLTPVPAPMLRISTFDGTGLGSSIRAPNPR